MQLQADTGVPGVPSPPRPSTLLSGTLVSVFLGCLCLTLYVTALPHELSAYFRPDPAFFSTTFSLMGLAVGAGLAGLGKRFSIGGGTALSAAGLTSTPASFLPSLLLFSGWPSLIALSLVQTVPLVVWGLYLGVLFRDLASRASVLVAIAAIGSALGLSLAFFIMHWAGGPVAALWISGGGMLVAALGLSRAKPTLLLCCLAAMAFGVGGLTTGWNKTPIPAWRDNSPSFGNLLSSMAHIQGGNLGPKACSWGAGARLDLLGLRQGDENVRWLFRNGNLHSVMPGQPQQKDVVAWLKEPFPLPLLPFLTRRPGSLLCIDPGGGLELRIASDLGVKNILAIEPEPGMASIWKATERFHGHLIERPGVKILYGDVRCLLEENSGTFDMVMLNLRPDNTLTWPGSAMNQDRLATDEALASYWHHLAPGGILVFSASTDLSFAKVLCQTMDLLSHSSGTGAFTSRERLWGFQVNSEGAAQNGYNFLLMAMKGNPPNGFKENMNAASQDMMVRTLFGPTAGAELPYSVVFNSGSPMVGRDRLAQIFSQQYHAPINLTGATDQRPFFYQFLAEAEPLTKWALGVGLGLAILFFVFPLPGLRPIDAPGASTRLPLPVFLCFFAALGIGALLAGSFLAHWVVASLDTVSRFSTPLSLGFMLVGLGTGAGYVRRIWPGWPTKIFAVSSGGTAILLLLMLWTTSVLPGAPYLHGGPITLAAAILTAFLFGVCLGPALPCGIEHLRRTLPDLLPWAIAVLFLSLGLGATAIQWLTRFHGYDMVGAWAAGCLAVAGILGMLLWRATFVKED